MRLAAGEWQAAADGYEALLDDGSDDPMRADLLRGLAEAKRAAGPWQGDDRRRCRSGPAATGPAERPMRRSLDIGWPTALPVRQRAGRAQRAHRTAGAGPRRAPGGAGLRDAAAHIPGRRRVTHRPGGTRAPYLEEARGLAADLDDRRRAAFLFNLAVGYREVGDFEAAIRCRTQGMALYRAAGAIFDRPASRTTSHWPIWPPARWSAPGTGRRRAPPDRGSGRRALAGRGARHRSAGRPGRRGH